MPAEKDFQEMINEWSIANWCIISLQNPHSNTMSWEQQKRKLIQYF